MKQTNEFKRQNDNGAALINVDNSGLAAYKRTRENMRKVGNIDERMNNLEESVDEIKNLLRELLGKK
ncbi:hypothetical protein UFOVP787_121 [uncultured Caudovirales phage]|uniref:Uncharacterized protein n=1 Tax=uncultured Caudovirales phage TaxID=2100421 RepID=A0A6J5NSQ5_9CAUD|nr:hypothetical protein UFOVP787_121 [uncultured Caudovirales phage]